MNRKVKVPKIKGGYKVWYESMVHDGDAFGVAFGEHSNIEAATKSVKQRYSSGWFPIKE